tara:strand:- start:1973 stop:2215 length:243 start_codon:yes stop_codon:yes gene_type:complete
MASVVVSVRVDVPTLNALAKYFGTGTPKGTLVRLAAEAFVDKVDVPSNKETIVKDIILSDDVLSKINAVELQKQKENGHG